MRQVIIDKIIMMRLFNYLGFLRAISNVFLFDKNTESAPVLWFDFIDFSHLTI